MRFVVYAMGSMLLLAVSGSASSQPAADAKAACFAGEGATAAEKVTSCSELISSGRYSGDDLALLYYNRGVDYGESDRPKAMADFTAAIRLNPRFANAWFNRAASEFWLKDYPRAIADYSEVIKLAPDDHEAFRDRGNAYYGIRDYPHAVADYGEAIRLKPGYAPYLNSRCRTRARWGRELAAALADCNAAISLDPKMAEFHDSRGLVYLKQGKSAAALADYDIAAQVGQNRAQALFGRGVAKKRSGKAADGARDIAAARSLDPTVVKNYAEWGIRP